MEPTSDRGLYVHVPFCRSRCHFCAFYLEIHHPAAAASFVHALLQEVRLYGRLKIFDDQPLTSVYVGGGTPTTLSAHQLRSTFAAIHETFAVDSQAEISIEAHPDTVTQSMLDDLRETGFNRISLGAESMEDEELVQAGRPGSAMGTARAVEAAKRAGFANFNLDLMYGLPGQTLASWQASLQRAMAMAPAHLSCYALTIEEDTKLEAAIRRNEIAAPNVDLQNEMEDLAQRELVSAGFHRYEISNYHRGGSECRHNLLYWSGGPYLGLGPSAQSYVGQARFGNVPNVAEYTGLLEAGTLPRSDIEYLSPRRRAREAVIFGLRKIEGIPAQLLREEPSPEWSSIVQRLIEEGYLERSDNTIRLTACGRRYADEVSMQLL